ncbi:MAG: PKD domain-containing protein [Bacteroidetes bacterium]|nr:PKD domain-containing protein [Bacteroidota bacterium]
MKILTGKNSNKLVQKKQTTTRKIIKIMVPCLLLLIVAVLYSSFSIPGNNKTFEKPEIIMDIPGYPLVFELNKGDSILIDRTYRNNHITKNVKLIDFRLFREYNSWFHDSLGKSDYYKAEIDIVVSGEFFTLKMQPYQLPVAVNGLRIYAEAVKEIDKIPTLDPVDKMEKDVRFSITLEGEPWGIPADLEFPVSEYRWRSASYNNTWGALVPFNLLYYHRGEDYGAIPDKLDVNAWVDGEIILSPLSGSKNGSNSIMIRAKNGLIFDYSHCNTEFIDQQILKGNTVKKGQNIARTGMTWDGRKSQHSDPHLHTGLGYNGYQLSLFPYAIEAYLRKYDDKVLAIAGGYRFAKAGETVELDGTRSVCRDGEKVVSYQWTLHDGQIVNQPTVKLKYTSPGYYSEELKVKTASGASDKDFLQVRVYDQNSNRKIAYGWAYDSPVRNIKSGQDVVFWNRLINTGTDVKINFGDGTAVQTMRDEIKHSYNKSGNYTVELSSQGSNNEPVSVKMEVIVD